MWVRLIFKACIIFTFFCMNGCVESSFNLAKDSRLPKWFEMPKGLSRSEVSVTMDYYIMPGGRKATFKLYKIDDYFSLKTITGEQAGLYPIELKNSQTGYPNGYPSYEVITVDGVTDIVEHRKMEPIFYMVDDPAIWKELGVKKQVAQMLSTITTMPHLVATWGLEGQFPVVSLGRLMLRSSDFSASAMSALTVRWV